MIATQWVDLDALAAFQKAKLEVKMPTVMFPKDYGSIPQTSDGNDTVFSTPSAGKGVQGHIFSFSDQKKLDTVTHWFAHRGKVNAALFSCVYVRDNLVVQLSGHLPKAQAQKYKLAMEHMK